MGTRFPTEPPMTVEAALRLPALRRGAPEVLAGSAGLTRIVRWAHSCEARHIPSLLEGDEMLLMTGMGLGGTAGEQRAFVRDLVSHRVSAVVIELGRVFKSVPAALVSEARRVGLPLIALHAEVRFVEVTKQLHSAILTRQLAVERRAAELHASLTALLIDGAEMPALLGRIAAAVGNPVLLERSSGEVVFHAAHRSEPSELLADWELLRVSVSGSAVGSSSGSGSGSLSDRSIADAPVVAAGGRAWGRLVVVGHERPIDSLTTLAVTRVAPLVALALSRGGSEPLLESRERGNFLHDIAAGRIPPEDIAARAHQLGLDPPTPLRLLPIVATQHRGQASTVRPQERGQASIVHAQERGQASIVHAQERGQASIVHVQERGQASTVHAQERGQASIVHAQERGQASVLRALELAGMHALVGMRSGDEVALLLAVPPELARRAAVEWTLGAMSSGGLDGMTVAVGPLVTSFDELPAAMHAAAETAEVMRDAPPRQWHDATVADVERLLWGLRDNERLAEFAQQRLAPVLAHRNRTLLPTLEALCDHHWHKAPAARALNIQRQSLYARIARLQQLLAADLDDPETRLGLDLAVRALRVVSP